MPSLEFVPDRTLVMPAESPQVPDPADWRDARVQPDWYDTIRQYLPIFDPLTTPTTMGAIPVNVNGKRVWVESADMANDDGVHFPVVGEQFLAAGEFNVARIGNAGSMLFSTRALVDFAADYFARELR